MRKSISLVILLIIVTAFAQAQVKTVAQYIEQVQTLANRADVKAANDFIDRNHESIMREWIAITEINAPSGQEQQRAKYIESLLRKYRLDDIHYDSAGNLIAVRKGSGGGPVIVFDAHMDTVFQPGLQIKATIRDGKIYAPGIGDDTRNVEALLATIRALNEAKIKTKGDLVFVFTVEEETTFKGVNTYVKENKRQDRSLHRARRRLRRFYLCRHRHQLVPAPFHRTRRPHALAHAAILCNAAAGARDRSHL